MRFTPYHLLLFLGFASMALAQGDPEYYLLRAGSPTWTTAAGVERGFVNLANGNLHLEIPLASSPQRGSASFSARLVDDSRIWRTVFNGTSSVWQPDNGPPSQGGWRFVTTVDAGSIDMVSAYLTCPVSVVTTNGHAVYSPNLCN